MRTVLSLNKTKTETWSSQRNIPPIMQNIGTCGTVLKQVQTFTYIGSLITPDG